MSVQVDLPDLHLKEQLSKSKKKIKDLEKTVKLQQKIIEGLENQTARGHLTDRCAGKIVKSSSRRIY
jgi:5-bromo-4-chloroindolyl phosphate hydrolysis protein